MDRRNVLWRDTFTFQSPYFLPFTTEVESVLHLFTHKYQYFYLSEGCEHFCRLFVSDNMQFKLQGTISVLLLHSGPVQLSASPLLLELKARNLQDAEEAVAHHAGDGIIDATKALSKPGERRKKDRARSKLNTLELVRMVCNNR